MTSPNLDTLDNVSLLRRMRYPSEDVMSEIYSAAILGSYFGRAPSGQALVSDQAASRLAPTGFDPSRKEKEL